MAESLSELSREMRTPANKPELFSGFLLHSFIQLKTGYFPKSPGIALKIMPNTTNREGNMTEVISYHYVFVHARIQNQHMLAMCLSWQSSRK